MESKKLVWIFMSVGMVIGGYLPLLWGGSEFSVSGILFSGIGGIVGIWIGWKFSQ
ncbi:MAG: hypothetical protein WC878_01980 [Candidatus Paceibacterota bacterium]|jgi:hypothetical protein